MAQRVLDALPAHLKGRANGAPEEGRHHGKTQSHMVRIHMRQRIHCFLRARRSETSGVVVAARGTCSSAASAWPGEREADARSLALMGSHVRRKRPVSVAVKYFPSCSRAGILQSSALLLSLVLHSMAAHRRRRSSQMAVEDMPKLIKINSLIEIEHDQAFENTSTSVAASQMRNSLNHLCDTVKNPADKKVRLPPSFARVSDQIRR